MAKVDEIEIDLNLINSADSRKGKRKLSKEELEGFVMDVLKHETYYLKERSAMHENGEIKEIQINDFPSFTDGYRTGIYLQMTPENTLPAKKDEKGKPVMAMLLYQKKDKEYILDKAGNKISANRVMMRISARDSKSVAIFIGKPKFDQVAVDSYVCFVGNYEEKQDEKWGLNRTMTVWQIAIISQKGSKLVITLPDCNWDEEE